MCALFLNTCSNRCASPVRSARSSLEPTRYHTLAHAIAADGSRWTTTSSPHASVRRDTRRCGASPSNHTGASAIVSAFLLTPAPAQRERELVELAARLARGHHQARRGVARAEALREQRAQLGLDVDRDDGAV